MSSVRLFVQEHGGDFNLELDLPRRKDAQSVIELIVKTGGYWYEGEVCLEYGVYQWENEPRSIFIPLHRIDRMEIKELGDDE